MMITREEAKAKGYKWYFTGEPCKYGHVADRQVSNLRCRECGKIACSKYSKANRESINSRRSTPEGKEKCAEYYRRIKNTKRKEYLKNSAKRRADLCRIYYEENKENIRKYKREYYYDKYRNDLDFKLACICRSMVWRASSRKSYGKRTASILGYSVDDFRKRIESQFKDGMTWDNYGEWHIDHIKPISVMISEGITDPGAINSLDNLQPLWAQENFEKGNRWNHVS